MSEDKILKKIPLFTIAGIAFLLIIWMLKLDSFKLNRWDPKFFVLLCSIIFLVIILLNIGIDKKKIKIPFIGLFERVSKIAFSSYYGFYVVELAIFPYINSHFLIYFNTFSLTLIYIFSYVFIVLSLSLFERNWSKYNYAFGVEWLLRSGVKIIMKFIKRSKTVRIKLR